MKNIEKWIIIILSIITIAAIGTAVYFGVNSTEKNNANDKVVDTNKEDIKNPDNNQEQISEEEPDDNKDAVAFCEANKEKIYQLIIENRNNSLAAIYDKKWLNRLPQVNSKDDLNCNYIESLDYDFYNLYFENSSVGVIFEFSKHLTFLNESYTSVDAEYDINIAFALDMSSEILGNEWGVTTDDWWEAGILSIYGDESVLLHFVDKDTIYPGELYSLYLVNLKTKTYERLK